MHSDFTGCGTPAPQIQVCPQNGEHSTIVETPLQTFAQRYACATRPTLPEGWVFADAASGASKPLDFFPGQRPSEVPIEDLRRTDGIMHQVVIVAAIQRIYAGLEIVLDGVEQIEDEIRRQRP